MTYELQETSRVGAMSAKRKAPSAARKVPDDWADPAYTVGEPGSSCNPTATVHALDTDRLRSALEKARGRDELGEEAAGNSFILNMDELQTSDGQLEWDDQEMFPTRTQRDEFIREKEESDLRGLCARWLILRRV